MRKKITLGVTILAAISLVLCLPACKKALTEGPDAHTNPLDPSNPSYINITIDGTIDADYGAAIGSGANTAIGCTGLDIKKVFVIDSANYWHFFVELNQGWWGVAGGYLAIYLEWAPGGAPLGIETSAGQQYFSGLFDPEGVIWWDLDPGVNFVDFYTYDPILPGWNLTPLQPLAAANKSTPSISPVNGHLEVRVPKSYFGATPPASLRVQVLSYLAGAMITSWDQVPGQGLGECYSFCCPSVLNAITVTATNN